MTNLTGVGANWTRLGQIGTAMFALRDELMWRLRLLRTYWNHILTLTMVLLSVCYLQSMSAGLDCTLNMDGHEYLNADPQIECAGQSDARYVAIYYQSVLGIGLWTVGAALLGFHLARGSAQKFAFIADKMKPSYYWWEVVLVGRKLLILAISSSSKGDPLYGLFWALMVVGLSLMAHSHAQPYRERLLHTCENVSLCSTLFFLAAGLIFHNHGSCERLVHDAANQSGPSAALLSHLEGSGVCMQGYSQRWLTRSTVVAMLLPPVLCAASALGLVRVDFKRRRQVQAEDAIGPSLAALGAACAVCGAPSTAAAANRPAHLITRSPRRHSVDHAQLSRDGLVSGGLPLPLCKMRRT